MKFELTSVSGVGQSQLEEGWREKANVSLLHGPGGNSSAKPGLKLLFAVVYLVFHSLYISVPPPPPNDYVTNLEELTRGLCTGHHQMTHPGTHPASDDDDEVGKSIRNTRAPNDKNTLKVTNNPGNRL